MSVLLRSAEVWVTVALLIISAIFLIDALKLPGGEFDPLGPGAAPEMVAAVLIPLCIIVLVRSVLRSRQGTATERCSETEAIGEDTGPDAPRSLFLFFALLVAYILAFQFEAAHFVLITTVFVFLATVALRGWNRRAMLISGSVALVLSVFLFLALTRFFVIRLPGAF